MSTPRDTVLKRDLQSDTNLTEFLSFMNECTCDSTYDVKRMVLLSIQYMKQITHRKVPHLTGLDTINVLSFSSSTRRDPGTYNVICTNLIRDNKMRS